MGTQIDAIGKKIKDLKGEMRSTVFLFKSILIAAKKHWVQYKINGPKCCADLLGKETQRDQVTKDH